MARRDETSPVVILLATLLASLVMHLVLWPLGDRLIRLSWRDAPERDKDAFMQVALVDEAKAEEPEEPPRETEPPGKLIKQDRVKKEAVPDEAKYVAEFDQKVDRETKAQNGRSKPGAAPVEPGTAPDANNLPPKPNLLDPRPQPKDRLGGAGRGRRGSRRSGAAEGAEPALAAAAAARGGADGAARAAREPVGDAARGSRSAREHGRHPGRRGRRREPAELAALEVRELL
jgi:hypothetical protein